MLKNQLDYNLLEALNAIVEHEQFEKAAKTLGISQSAISQRLKLLEQQIGQPSLIRTNPPTLTEVGERLLAHYRHVATLENDLLQDLYKEESSEWSKFGIGINADSLATWLLPAIKPLLKKNRILVECYVDDQDETLELLRSGVVAGCISSIERTAHGCQVTYLGKMNYWCVSTPNFKKKYFKTGVTKENIKQAPACIYNKKDKLHFAYLKKYFRFQELNIPFHLVPSSEGFVDTALAGIAYALIPRLQCEDYCNRGKLVNLTPAKLMSIDLYWHSWSEQPAKLQLLSDALVTYAQKHLC